MPDAAGLELIRQECNEAHPGSVLDTSFEHGQGALIVDPARVLDVLGWLREAPAQEYRFLASLHAADYLPAEPRFGIHYELLNMPRAERIRVKALLADPAAPGRIRASSDHRSPSAPSEEAAGNGVLPVMQSCVEMFPTADFQEREVYDMFGIAFEGHPDLRRILMPEDYVGWPQRRDFPLGGEPVLFTKDEPGSPGWYE